MTVVHSSHRDLSATCWCSTTTGEGRGAACLNSAAWSRTGTSWLFQPGRTERTCSCMCWGNIRDVKKQTKKGYSSNCSKPCRSPVSYIPTLPPLSAPSASPDGGRGGAVVWHTPYSHMLSAEKNSPKNKKTLWPASCRQAESVFTATPCWCWELIPCAVGCVRVCARVCVFACSLAIFKYV